MRPIWKGAVSFGLVNIPVKMYAASEDMSLKFKLLHQKCKTPLRYRRECPHCHVQVEGADIVKGYEYQKDRFVVLNESDFESVSAAKSRTIDILDFCQLAEIDPIYYEKSYFLGPEETGKKAYNLLVSTLRESARVAVAKVVIRSRQSLAALRIYKDVLVLETMKYPDEVRSQLEVPGVDGQVLAGERELQMAKQLVEGMTGDFVPEKYTDDYRSALLDMIQGKLAGEEPALSPAPAPEGVVDLMESLRSSIEALDKERFTPGTRKKAKKEDQVG